MRRFSLILLPLLLTSCIKSVNLQDRAIVQAIGIDFDGEYVVTMQIFSPDGSGGQTIVDPTKQNAKVLTTRGSTVAEALEGSSLSQGKRFFFGHNRLIILGKSALNKDLGEVLAFFKTSETSRADVRVIVSETDARKILEAPINQGILPAHSIEKTVENAFDNSKISNIFLLDVLKDNNILIPKIDLADTSSLKTVEITGSVLYTDKIYKGEFDFNETRGILYLENNLKSAVYSLENGVAIKVYRSKSKVKDDILFVDVKTEILEIKDEKTLETAYSQLVKEITLQVKSAISRAESYGVFAFSGVREVKVTPYTSFPLKY